VQGGPDEPVPLDRLTLPGWEFRPLTQREKNAKTKERK